MRILVDTNICLDILQKRPGLFQSSRDALIFASNKGYKLYITTATVMDIMYITRKSFSDNVQQSVNLIITRNIKDFVTSPVKAVTPEDFLNK